MELVESGCCARLGAPLALPRPDLGRLRPGAFDRASVGLLAAEEGQELPHLGGVRFEFEGEEPLARHAGLDAAPVLGRVVLAPHGAFKLRAASGAGAGG